MISTARFPTTPAVQHTSRDLKHTLDPYPGSSEHTRIQSASHQQHSSLPSSAFNFEFRLENDVLGGRKQRVHRNHDHPVNYNMSSFSDPARHYTYGPAPLQIPSHAHPSTHSPSTYVSSSTTALDSQPFLDLPQSSNSHSLSPSPLDRPTWPEQSASSLSLRPSDDAHSRAPDLGFDARLGQMSFTLGIQPSHSPLHLNMQGTTGATDPHSHSSNGNGSPLSDSNDSSEANRPKIGPNGLAEDQPPTAQGKMRTRVYVACLQCRSRKIRCDGGKPKCMKCTRRASDCQYDAAPKRRGPDKKPGARQRTSKKAKAAKEEAMKNAGAESDAWERGVKAEGREDGRSAAKRRRKATDGFLTWPVDDGDRDSIATSPVEASARAKSREGLQAPFDPLQDLPNGAKGSEKEAETLFNPFVGVRPQMQPIPSDGFPVFLGLNTEATSQSSNVRMPEPSSVMHHRQQPYPNTITNVGTSYLPHAQIHTADEEDQQRGQNSKPKWDEIGSEPSLDFARKTWWDNLLAIYSPNSNRTQTALEIHRDLQFLFKSSNYFLCFFNVPLFFSTFCNPEERDRMQSSLVLAGLAVSTFMRSNEIELGHAGRMRALWLRDAAQSALEASYNARWIEPTLAQAAFLLALFEVSAHPQHTSERSRSSMVMLDSIVRALGLMSIDANDPAANIFSARAVPTLPPSSTVRQEGCSCDSLTLGLNSRSSQTHTPLWAATPAWNPDWTVPEIRKEESRRLCWSSLQLAAGHLAHASAFSAPVVDYHCVQPANYAVFFPGEALMQTPTWSVPHSGKETVWALYARAMLLWSSCLRMREDDISDDERAMYAVGAWLETTAIEEALDAHTCGCDQAFMYQGREFLFMTRMCISYEFRRYIPHPESDVNGLFNRKKAMAWLLRQGQVAKRLMNGLHTVTGHKTNLLAQRPFFVWWFMNIVARSLMLFACDQSLVVALEVSQSFLPPIEYLTRLWPCAAQRTKYQALHARLTQACHTAGVRPPSPPNFDPFAPGSPPMNVI